VTWRGAAGSSSSSWRATPRTCPPS
jgi:hypothetical protein